VGFDCKGAKSKWEEGTGLAWRVLKLGWVSGFFTSGLFGLHGWIVWQHVDPTLYFQRKFLSMIGFLGTSKFQ